MATRTIIEIDEDKCTGCGLCIPGCPEGALQIIDGKARLVSDLLCDGLGACIGECPEGAITTMKREAEPYDERKVMVLIAEKGENTIRAHIDHLREHEQHEYLKEAIAYLRENNIPVPKSADAVSHNQNHQGHSSPGGCPGSRMMDFSQKQASTESEAQPSQLQQWPVQLHLVSPMAPYFKDADVVLSADCVAYSLGDFHKDYLKGKKLAIACPKLDSNQQIYLEKVVALIDSARINTLTVMTMEVPCCRGLLEMAKQALNQAERKIPLKSIIVGIQGGIIKEDWV